MTLTGDRPKTKPGLLIVEFHPPLGVAEEKDSQQVRTEDAVRWPHVISYS